MSKIINFIVNLLNRLKNFITKADKVATDVQSDIQTPK